MAMTWEFFGAYADVELMTSEAVEEACGEELHGQYALTIGGDAVAAITGTREMLRAFVAKLAEAIDPPAVLPDFPMPEAATTGDEVTCPHVYGVEEVETAAAYTPEAGTVCGAPMQVIESVADFRPVHWAQTVHGALWASIGGGSLGDGEFESFECLNGHAFAPDWNRTDYGL